MKVNFVKVLNLANNNGYTLSQSTALKIYYVLGLKDKKLYYKSNSLEDTYNWINNNTLLIPDEVDNNEILDTRTKILLNHLKPKKR